MSKVKKSGATRYEILYIVANKFTEDEVREINSRVNKIIEGNGGVIIESDLLGKRKLAYRIQKYDHGYYNLIIFDSKGEKVATMERLIRMMKEIIRHVIVVHQVKSIVPAISKKELEKEITERLDKVGQEAQEEVAVKEDGVKEDSSKKLDEKLDDLLTAKDLF